MYMRNIFCVKCHDATEGENIGLFTVCLQMPWQLAPGVLSGFCVICMKNVVCVAKCNVRYIKDIKES